MVYPEFMHSEAELINRSKMRNQAWRSWLSLLILAIGNVNTLASSFPVPVPAVGIITIDGSHSRFRTHRVQPC